jgi:DNA-binding GntR family transcriptional regulator
LYECTWRLFSFLDIPISTQAVNEHHMEIYMFIGCGDGASAARAMTEHIEYHFKEGEKALRNSKSNS